MRGAEGCLSFRRALRVLIAGVLMLAAEACFAHPMGNFSISHYAAITIDGDGVEVRYIIDMAEIPTFQEMQQFGITGRQNDPKLSTYLSARAAELGSGLHLLVNGHSIRLEPLSQSVIFPPGAGGLPTMKSGFVYRGTFPQSCVHLSCRLTYEDVNYSGHAGWKEIVVHTGRNLTLQSSTAPDHDRSALLTNYPTDLVNSPPQALSAAIVFVAIMPPTVRTASVPAAKQLTELRPALHGMSSSASPVTPAAQVAAPPSSAAKEPLEIAPNAQRTPRSAFTELIAAPRLGLRIALIAVLIASGLGAFHALEPGHGKTIVAAYLVGAKGTARHAFLLGMLVTITHTAGVYMLGAVTLYAQKYVMPEKLYPMLGVLSGILIAGMGIYLFLQRLAGAELLHSHADGGVAHRHFGWLHSHGPREMSTAIPIGDGYYACSGNRTLPMRQLLVLGITGGIVPCPAALVVLLSALALHRIAFGLLLIVAFSTGLAAVLIAMGMAAVYAGRWMSSIRTEGPLIQRWLPFTSAAMITALGCAIALRALMTAGIFPIHA